MDLSSSLEALGVDSLAHITLEELQDKVNSAQHGILSRQQVLHTFIGWLHERIIRDIQRLKSLMSEFAHLLLVPGRLQWGPFSEREVAAVLKQWKVKDTAENPANLRRYQMVQLDFLELFEQAEHDSDSEADWSSGPSGLDREQYSPTNTDEPIGFRIVGGGKQKSGSNDIPLGKRKASHDSNQQKITKTMVDNKNGGLISVYVENKGHTRRVFLDFGSVSPKQVSPAKAYKPVLREASPRMHDQFFHPPPPSYVCNRCSKPGHWIQLCPTNLDPSWDQPPPSNYCCEICMKQGDHYATLCPQNKNEISLTQQRQRREGSLQAQLRTPVRGRKPPGRDRHRHASPFRRRSRSPKDSRRHQAFDMYRPGDGHSRVRDSNRDNREKFRDRNSISPYTARRRMTFGEYFNHEKDSGNRHDGLSQTPPRKLPYRRSKAPSPRGEPRSSLDLSKSQKGEIGRLSYDNDVFMNFDGSSLSPNESIFSPKPKVVNTEESKVTQDAPVVAEDTPEEMEQAKVEANEFLDKLANERFLGKALVRFNEASPVSESPDSENASVKGVEGRLGDNMSIDGGEDARCGVDENSLTSSETGQHTQELKCRSKVISLFENRENPIIHNRANRKTAGDMFDEV
ncbi:hypothetical protein F4781DRAFT_150652 [Annulohypoxylon bovei var. microspora]|nr:hypothetical protein F4781DRAFT_150652 [Annulohypoxylon bovei var. microspora]